MRKPLTDAELAELQNPGTWDWESAERHPPNPLAGAVVRVHMTAAEFREIMDAVRTEGTDLETLIREAALAYARRQAQESRCGSETPVPTGEA
jgi:hypothetical protein